MATTVEQTWDGPDGDGESRDLRYFVHDPAGMNDIAARTAVMAVAPSTHDGLNRDSKKIRAERVSDKMYLCIVPYSAAEKSTDGFTFSFDTTGGQRNVKQSLETVASNTFTGDDGSAPDFKGAIGVNEKGDVEGIDIVEPKLGFSFTRKIPLATISNPTWIKSIAALTGTVNSGSFMGFSAGEVLFLGATGSQSGPGEDVDVTFNFAGSQNITGLMVPNIEGTIDKKGWEYMWCKYSADESNGRTIRKPTAAYVEKVYPLASFSALEP